MQKRLRIGFFGTPHLASQVLADLLEDPRFEVVFVVTNPDKPVGRSGQPQPSPVAEVAKRADIKVLQPMKIR